MANDRLIVKSQVVEYRPCIDAVIAAIADRPNPAVLDSADAGPSRGRYTIVACDPVEVASFRAGDGDPFEQMRRKLAQTSLGVPAASEMSTMNVFPCGWIGYFTYEAGGYIERLPSTTLADIGLPIARFGLYDVAAIHDAVTGRWTLVAADLNCVRESKAVPTVEDRLAEWKALLQKAKTPSLIPPPQATYSIDNMTRAQYLNMVARAKDYIAAGDIFQVNLARRLTCPVQEPAVATYLRLRHTNPGAYAAFLSWYDSDYQTRTDRQAAILSASPELFLQLKGRRVLTRPIKGTRPRADDSLTDAAYQMDLACSEKDRAELAMIVDLERNDIGRVCEFGSVRVEAADSSPAYPYELETHPTVHHLVANITGRLKEPYDVIDLLRACYPGGSITGAPKVRAMEIIDELEPTERSVYTGAIGYFGLDGSMTFNIAIRTMILADGRLHIYAGGGIVADSVPEDEYEETQVKALGLCRTLGLDQTPASIRSAAGRIQIA